MRVVFDNCTSPVLAATLNGFLAHRGGGATHVRDLPCGRQAGDARWMASLAQGGDGWLVVTGDGRLLRNRAQRLAYRQAGLRALVLAPAFLMARVHAQAAALIGRWPEIEDLERCEAPCLFELPMDGSDKLKALSF